MRFRRAAEPGREHTGERKYVGAYEAPEATPAGFRPTHRIHGIPELDHNAAITNSGPQEGGSKVVRRSSWEQHWPGYLPPWSVGLIACLGKRTRRRWPRVYVRVTTGTGDGTHSFPAENVRARWAYSELLSDRPYDDPSLQGLKKKALRRIPFEDLGAEEHGLLAQAWYPVRRAHLHSRVCRDYHVPTGGLVEEAARHLLRHSLLRAHEIGAYERPVTFKQWIES